MVRSKERPSSPGAPVGGIYAFFANGLAGGGASKIPERAGFGEAFSKLPYGLKSACGRTVNSPILSCLVMPARGRDADVDGMAEGGEGPIEDENHFRGKVNPRYEEPDEVLDVW